MECLHPQRGRKVVRDMEFDYVYRCGNCKPCQMHHRECVVTRIMLESAMHPPGWTAFITLTYANAPLTDKGVPTLRKEDLQDFLKRLRWRFPAKTLRHVSVGEYGEKSGRPHYHLIVFGAPLNRIKDAVKGCWPEAVENPAYPDRSDERWINGLGWSEITPVSLERARYVAGYTMKKWMQRGTVPAGAADEFTHFSRRPALAQQSAEAIWQSLARHGMDVVLTRGNLVRRGQTTVPGYVRFNDRMWPLDSFLKKKLLDYVSLTSESDLRKAVRQETISRRLPVGTALWEQVEKYLESMTLESDDRRPKTLRSV